MAGLLVISAVAPPFVAASFDAGRFGSLRLAGAPAAAASRPTKTAQDCNNELREQSAAIAEAGMSPAAFFHTCWYHSEPGKPTPIVADPRAKAPFAGPKSRPASLQASDEEEDTARAIRQAARRHRAERRRIEAASFAPRRRFPAEPDDATALVRRSPRDVLLPIQDTQGEIRQRDEPRAQETQAATPERALPREIRVNVPMVGPVAVPILPLPGLAAMVRVVVDHPVVPGLVTTSP